ncbi:DUF6796 family protein [Aquimarina hainanensis]|uniref:DUF6796 family protein n=1 Tax=Aquimarina hainanensis TaxID=1578017 RepID=A0ABW5NED1_9FLAO|nr:DUF6796 family protein [Aquimarina sp. TRL1]QKX06610.1 hypothetical protein HN014_17380 [Aquimarina sp. TRL1]
MKKRLKITGILGILGTLLMFSGDMFLYYTTEDFMLETELIEVLGNIDHDRLTIGGMLGPLAAVLYFIGFYQIYMAIKPHNKTIARIIFGLYCLAMSFGGAFHSQFTYLGLVSYSEDSNLLKIVQDKIMLFYAAAVIPTLIASILFAVMILIKKTNYPRWMVLCTPIVLFPIFNLVQLLPQPYMVVVAGGWSNHIYLIFFSVSTYVLLRDEEKRLFTRMV